MKSSHLLESERIAALNNYDIMDSLPEKEYDDMTRLAALICGTPVALVSLVGSGKQFFKSRFGLSLSETSKEDALCAHAIQQPDELMAVSDLRTDPRFSRNPLVTGPPHVVFYAGVPLVNGDGYALGTLCVMDYEPKQLTGEQEWALKSLSRQVMQLLELRRKNSTLEISKKQLSLRAKEMKEFAHMASHDLKEPLRMVTSFLKLLEDRYSKNYSESEKKYIAYAVDGANRMRTLINDLLEFSESGNPDKNIEQVDLNGVIDGIRELYQSEINKNKIVINASPLPVIRVSGIAIHRVFQNLIDNAIKYQEKGSIPLVTIGYTETNTHWEFSIKDNGIGIDQEHLTSIFTIFKRLHRKEDYPGTGIGLAICKKIVEYCGGEIGVTSEEKKGSTFYFSISKNL
jgi:signal transduction histidine kinase